MFAYKLIHKNKKFKRDIMAEQNFIDRLKSYNEKRKATNKQIPININVLSSFDFLNETDFFQRNPIMYDDKIWWKWDWDSKSWYIVEDVEIILDFSNNFILQGITTSVFHSNIRTAILNALKQAGLIFKKEFKKDIKKTWIVFKDCIVDVETGETFQHDFCYFATNPLPYNYQETENTDTSKFDQLFSEWVIGGDQDNTWVDTLYEVLAYCMLPDYPVEVLFCLHGDGSNGKSSFIELLMNFIGMYNCSATELSLLTNPNSRFETIALHKKLVCLMSELDDSTINNTSLLKKLTGNKEPIRGEYKGKGSVIFINYAKIIMSTNIIPDTTDKTDGYYRRWLVIDFPNKFEATNGNVLKNITYEDYSALAKKCIPILQDILKKSTFTNFKSIADRRERYESKANPLKRFIDEMCMIDPNTEIPVFEFHEVVSSWMLEKGYRVISKPKLSRLMKENGFESEPRHNSDVNKTWRYYIGINLKKENYAPVKVYSKEKNKFEEIKEFRSLEYGKEYNWSQVCQIFNSYSEDELRQSVKDWKKQGAVTEVRSGVYRFESNRGSDIE